MPSGASTSPTVAFGPSYSLADAEKVVSVVVWIIFVMWLIYTLVATYHWLKYGHRSPIAIPAIIVHVVVSISLALFAISGLAGT